MPGDKGHVDWYGEQVYMVIKGATDEVLTRAAALAVRYAKLNIQANNQIDTGFMWNSVYFKARRENTYQETWKSGSYPWDVGKHQGQAGAGDRVQMEDVDLPAWAAAIVAVAAAYGIYQEMLRPFLWPAMESAAKGFKGIAESVAKEKKLK